MTFSAFIGGVGETVKIVITVQIKDFLPSLKAYVINCSFQRSKPEADRIKSSGIPETHYF